MTEPQRSAPDVASGMQQRRGIATAAEPHVYAHPVGLLDAAQYATLAERVRSAVAELAIPGGAQLSAVTITLRSPAR